MSNGYDPLEEAFNDALEEAGAGLGFEPEGYDGFGPEGLYENEGDAFSFRNVFKSAGRLVQKLPMRQLAQKGAMIAGGAIGGPIGARVGSMVGGMLGEEEGFEPEGFDFEEEGESGLLQEDESEAFGLDSFTDSLAESLATLAAESESESESAALLGGVTIHIITRAPVSVKRMSPVFVKSANRLGRFLRGRRSTRPLVKTIPRIQKEAVRMLTRHARNGGKVTPAAASKAMAKATLKTLGTPRAAASSLANNKVKSRRAATAPGRPGPAYKKTIARAER